VSRNVLVDAGPLVALFSRKDSNHDLCVSASKAMAPPYLTPWPVLTETAWLLRHYPLAVKELLQSIGKDFLKILDLDQHFVGWSTAFLERYENIGVQLADASLVYLAERERVFEVFTLDRRDFTVYRTTRNRALKIVP
jgi:predicted nucleic acid-binding protein